MGHPCRHAIALSCGASLELTLTQMEYLDGKKGDSEGIQFAGAPGAQLRRWSTCLDQAEIAGAGDSLGSAAHP